VIKKMLLTALLFLSLMLSIPAYEQGSPIAIKTDESGYTSYDESNLCRLPEGYSTSTSGDAPTPESPPSPESHNSTENSTSPTREPKEK
jgi:hypothetical protein